ncbi:hypothetical protein C8R46DRAFT_491289 [Mycena filopes]|nr:hypothetical protein C8R46DRAFT_491289 [Mycena filopes]
MVLDNLSIVGPMLIGALISWLLMGIYTMQAHTYFMCYHDKIWIRTLVINISLLEITQWIISTVNAWYYLKNWGDLAQYLIIPWSANALVVLCGIASIGVQSFYAWRIWMISYDVWLLRIAAILIETLSLMQGCSAIAGAALLSQTPTEAEIALHPHFFDVWLIGSLTTDTLISFCMLWILFQARNRTHWETSKLMFNKLIVNTVKTGSATTIVAAVTLVLFDLFRDHNYYGTTFIFLQKMYSISLLVNLNARQRSSSGVEDQEVAEINFSDIVIQTTTSVHTASREEDQSASYSAPQTFSSRGGSGAKP